MQINAVEKKNGLLETLEMFTKKKREATIEFQ